MAPPPRIAAISLRSRNYYASAANYNAASNGGAHGAGVKGALLSQSKEKKMRSEQYARLETAAFMSICAVLFTILPQLMLV
jgi:hypothetical protein